MFILREGLSAAAHAVANIGTRGCAKAGSDGIAFTDLIA